MAKNPSTTEPEGTDQQLDKLVAEKIAAGLSKDDAVACAKAQIAHDAALAAEAKKAVKE